LQARSLAQLAGRRLRFGLGRHVVEDGGYPGDADLRKRAHQQSPGHLVVPRPVVGLVDVLEQVGIRHLRQHAYADRKTVERESNQVEERGIVTTGVNDDDDEIAPLQRGGKRRKLRCQQGDRERSAERGGSAGEPGPQVLINRYFQAVERNDLRRGRILGGWKPHRLRPFHVLLPEGHAVFQSRARQPIIHTQQIVAVLHGPLGRPGRTAMQ